MNTIRSLFVPCRFFQVAALVSLVSMSGGARASAADEPAMPAKPLTAVAVLQPAAGSEVRGTVTFAQVKDGVRVVANVTGLTPGPHGFHVHEKGDLSAPDLMSAGGHYNPTNDAHAGRDAAQRHAGDMGNIVADDKGVARLDYVDSHLALSGENSILGRSVIVHAGADDMKSQPAGAAGPRVAGGVITLVPGK